MTELYQQGACETVKVETDIAEFDYLEINKSDFDPEKHKVWEGEIKENKPPAPEKLDEQNALKPAANTVDDAPGAAAWGNPAVDENQPAANTVDETAVEAAKTTKK